MHFKWIAIVILMMGMAVAKAEQSPAPVEDTGPHNASHVGTGSNVSSDANGFVDTHATPPASQDNANNAAHVPTGTNTSTSISTATGTGTSIRPQLNPGSTANPPIPSGGAYGEPNPAMNNAGR